MKKGLILGLILGLWASPAAAQIPTNCVTENAGRSWSLTFPATDTLRFELRAGDRWQYDSVGAERTEIDCYKSIFPPGSAINISYEFMWEAGAANAAQWIIFGQFHNNDNYSNPPAGFITAPRSDIMTVGLSYGTTTSRTAITPWRDTLPLQRGRWYKIQIQANFSPQGFFRVWRDGMQIVNYTGPLGYENSTGTYWKNGIYRGNSTDTQAVQYRNLVFGTGTMPAPTPTPPHRLHPVRFHADDEPGN